MISRPKFSQGAKRDHWQQQIDNWKRSGLSQKQYCLRHSLALSTFCYWKKRLNRQDPVSPKFYPLALPDSIPATTDAGLILLVGQKQIQIQIKKDFSPATLKRLITTLEQL